MAKPSLKKQLDDLLERLQPEIRQAFQAVIARITNRVVLTDLIAAIEVNDYRRAYDLLNMSDAAMRPLVAVLQSAFEQGGIMVAQSLPRIRSNGIPRAVFDFDVGNPRAETWLREQSSRLITRIKEDARVNVMSVMADNLEKGNNPRTTALDIVGRINATTGKREGGIIGLSQPQELWARNARIDLETIDEAPQELWIRNARKDLETLNNRYFKRSARDKRFDSIVAKAIATKKPLDKATIDKLVSRYKDGLLKLRGETIARTETLTSLHRAEWEAMKQVVETGGASESDVRKVWDTSGDSRVRDSHAEMDGQEVGLDEPFVTPDGDKLMYPGDSSLGADGSEVINCRCKIRYNVDFFSE